jgi:hypothetical protein
MISQTFYPTPQIFLAATSPSKRKRMGKVFCPDCAKSKRLGVLFSVEQPRIRWGLNQQTYQCDTCDSIHVVQSDESL